MLYALLTGFTIGVIVQAFTAASVATAFASAATAFGGAAVYGATTRRRLDSIGAYAVMALIGVLVAGGLNLWLRNSTVDLGVSLVGVVVFVIFTAWDVQRIKGGYHDKVLRDPWKAAVFGAFELYLDFVNLFLRFLRLFGRRR